MTPIARPVRTVSPSAHLALAWRIRVIGFAACLVDLARFHQLESVSERIAAGDTKMAFERVLADVDTGLTKTLGEPAEIAHEQRGMRLPGRTKVRVHSEMDLHGFALEPGTAPPGELRWLRD